MNFLKHLQWRYATKRMTGAKVPTDKLNKILEAIRFSASSLGLQPYNIFVVENAELKEQLQKIAFNQPQISKASQVIVFAVWDNLTEERINDYFERVKEIRGNYPDNMQMWKNHLMEKITKNTPEENFNWLARQAYIGLGTGLAAAAIEEVDSTPMEGFEPAKLDKLLGLKAKHLRSVLIMPLGYRDMENDFLVNLPKVRRAENQFIQFYL